MTCFQKGRAVPEINRDEERAKARLAQLLREARQEFLRSGEPMLDWDGLEREIAECRGGRVTMRGGGQRPIKSSSPERAAFSSADGRPALRGFGSNGLATPG
jgi:hypothetical protein